MNRIRIGGIRKLSHVRLFDVTLRDGIQAATLSAYPTEKKQEIFKFLVEHMRPDAIEIGSLASPKVLPIMSDSLEMYKYAREYLDYINMNIPVYMLIPSFSKLMVALQTGITHYSFITSLSNAFQLKNTNKTLNDAKHELTLMNIALNQFDNTTSKLYISCVNECPIQGKLSIDYIVHEILYYASHFDELCLSDTCGTLTFEDFITILDNVIYHGVQPSKLSLHLHVNTEGESNAEKIIRYCLEKKVNKFDVSYLSDGGCSVTMNKNKLKSNLSYSFMERITRVPPLMKN